ncbi:nudix domain-containing [Trichoderma arundinaceum]|uniref:Nudix domain-containing n=1 Tax=Trichoderma arundinaceum TaxID=490622 RepID=A0A395NC03_TRIAR|nr:nudix domain-containing [Trichoderma arundinaceum]
MATQHPKVGVAAVIGDANGKFLVGKRKGAHGAGESLFPHSPFHSFGILRACDGGVETEGAGAWQFPGGHLEFGEDLVSCAERETEEETSLVVKGAGLIAVTNDVFETDNKHYITLFVKCAMTDIDAVPQLTEPEKCEGWHWKTWEELKQIDEAARSGASTDRLFLPLVNLIKQNPNVDNLM